jgi:hypothetical protein
MVDGRQTAHSHFSHLWALSALGVYSGLILCTFDLAMVELYFDSKSLIFVFLVIPSMKSTKGSLIKHFS